MKNDSLLNDYNMITEKGGCSILVDEQDLFIGGYPA